MSYNAYRNSAVGLSLRFGPLVVGTTNLLPYFAKVNIFGADAHVALKLPLFHRGAPKDTDGDGVSDKKDNCVEVPGTWTFRGCPDTDLDGIPDIDDDCPTDSGLVELNGCPDRDQDGITDRFDKCPDLFGELAFQGCPDTDGDSIIDPEDKCPELAGILFYAGCPDTDGDSIIDPEDLCPEYPGPLSNQGCPDRDNDGLFDYLDECPEEAGPADNNGCPWPDSDEDGILDKNDRCPNNPGPKENDGCPYTDTDGDGVFDKDDDCPNVPGPAENAGCPVIEEEEQEIINTAFSNLEFETGKDVIRASSLGSLDELADLLMRKTEWKLLLAGHTDNVGNDQSNLILSKKRAEAVKKYLTKKGVNEAVIRVEFYGETKPIGDNNTEEGRQKNRRVEMEIQFE
jgi:outer membrane protein OmpA-like peptidoglycan-associated protein